MQFNFVVTPWDAFIGAFWAIFLLCLALDTLSDKLRARKARKRKQAQEKEAPK